MFLSKPGSNYSRHGSDRRINGPLQLFGCLLLLLLLVVFLGCLHGMSAAL